MDLQALIAATKGDRSYHDLARDSGGQPGFKWWQQRGANNPPVRNFPEPETVVAIAQALGVTQDAVIAAFAESLGLQVRERESKLVALLPAGTELLSDTEVAAFLSLLRAMVERARASEGVKTGG